VSRFLLEHLPAFWVVTLITAGLNAIIAMGVYFSNAAGALSACHAALAGMGAYVAAVLTTNFDLPFPVALLAGAVFGFATGMLLALVTGYISSNLRDAVAFAVLLAVLFFRPQGLFGSYEV